MYRSESENLFEWTSVTVLPFGEFLLSIDVVKWIDVDGLVMNKYQLLERYYNVPKPNIHADPAYFLGDNK